VLPDAQRSQGVISEDDLAGLEKKIVGRLIRQIIITIALVIVTIGSYVTGIAYLFIAHDLAVVEHISDHVLVMHHGKIVESASAEAIYNDPQNDYTKTLLAAVPSIA
jgi:ABC-type microcin C transport system duplicated ATPase subunit YejF